MADIRDYFKQDAVRFPNQPGIVSPDGEATARRFHEVFGTGPFYETINDFSYAEHRGKPIDVKLHAYYSWEGETVIEIVQVLSEDENFYHEFSDISKVCLNHLHIQVPDIQEALEAANALGYETITVAYSAADGAEGADAKAAAAGVDIDATGYTSGKPSFAIVYMEDLGLLVQFVEPISDMLYGYIKQKIAEWDGTGDIIRPLLG